MKRILSLVLALVMVLGTFTSIASGEEINSREKLFNDLRNKFSLIQEDESKDDFFSILTSIYAQRSNIFDSLSNQEYLQSKGIDESTIEDIFDVLIVNRLLIEKVATDKSITYSEVAGELDKFLLDLYNIFPEATKGSIGKYASSREDKINIMVSIINTLFNEKLGTGQYSLKTKKWTALKLEVRDSQISTINKEISSDENKPLNETHKEIINSLISGSVNVLSADLTDSAGELLYKSGIIKKVEVDKEPTTPPSGGGGGGSSSGSSPSPTKPKSTTPSIEVEVPKDNKSPAKVILGEGYIQITKDKDGQTTVKVKETEGIKAIEELRKVAGKNRAANIELNAEKLKGLNYKVELSQKLVKALDENNIALVIKTGESELEIPLEVIKSIKIKSGFKLELRVEEVSTGEAKKLAQKEKIVKKAIDLNLVLVKGEEEIKVTRFKSPITVKINIKGLGNPDKLAAYYLNEEENVLEFVTGRIEDNMLVLRLSHFSQYIILESQLTFEDLENHWSKIFVESMAAKHIINGYEDGTFKPNDDITRSEFTKMIVLALELDIEEYKGTFTDVESDVWYADYVGTMVKNGLIKGYEDGTFKPNHKITRAEMANIIGNVLDLEVNKVEKKELLGELKDKEDIKAWVEDSVAKVVKSGIMVGDENNNFKPNETTTRGEAATAIYRLYNR